MEPLVSIIMPVFNAEKYLSAAVNSIVNQSFRNWELLMVDNGSTDESVSICEHFVQQNDRIKLFSCAVKGPSAARNMGLDHAKGQLITFIDSDDYYDTHYLQKAYAFMESHQADVVICGFHTDFYDEQDKLERTKDALPQREIFEKDLAPVLSPHNANTGFLGFIWNKLYRASVIQEKRVRFDESMFLYEDLAFNAAVFTNSSKICFLDEAFCHYIQRPSPSLVKRLSDNYFELIKSYINSVKTMFTYFHLSPETIQKRLDVYYFHVLKEFLKKAVQADLKFKEKMQTIGLMLKDVAPFINVKINVSFPDRVVLYSAKRKLAPVLYCIYKLKDVKRLVEMIKKLKRLIPESVKAPVFAALQPAVYPELEQYKGKKKILLMLAGHYQNLGDMAITYAQKKFLEDHFPDHSVIEIGSTSTYKYIKALKKLCTPADIVTIIGGGNMDDLYVSLENARRFVIKSFPKNRVISFPQTFAFSDSEFGKKRLQKTVKTYSRHKALTVFGREPVTLEQMKNHFVKNQVGYCPDIVLYLNQIEPSYERHGLIVCIRDDYEAKLTKEQRDEIKRGISEKYDDIIFTDTVNCTLEESLPENRDKTLNDFWTALKKSKVVLTDRLHCMIFCAITKTPCVVLENSNHKISGIFDVWLKNLGYIKLIPDVDVDKITEAIDEYFGLDLNACQDVDLKEKFKPLVDAVKGNYE